AWGLHRLGRSRFVLALLRVCAAVMLGFFALFATLGLDHAYAGPAFFVFVSVYNLFIVSVFWSVMADRFRLECSKRLFGLISVGGTLGGVVGALAMGLSSGASFGVAAPVWAVFVSAITLEVAARCFRAIDRVRTHTDPARDIAPGVLTGVTAILRSRYLRGVCAYITLSSVVWTLLYIEQGRIIGAHVASDADRIAIFAAIDVASNALAVVVQLFASGFIMRRFGVGVALALLPAIGVAGFLALPTLPAETATGLAPVVWGLIVFQVLRRGVQFGVSKPARATLFTVVGPDERYKAKSVIDTYVYRSGDALGAGASKWLVGAGAALPYVAAGLAFLWLLSGVALGASQKKRAGIAGSSVAQGPTKTPAFAGV
ncbi:MAG: hypothetical protein AAGH64_12630, partial [Planctomycetota bacterium]